MATGCSWLRTISYPAHSKDVKPNASDFYTTGTMRFSEEDLIEAFERAAASTGGIVTDRSGERLTGTVTKKTVLSSCADELKFAAYFEQIDDRPTARYTVLADHTSFCGSANSSSTARAVGSEMIANFNMILSTYE